MSDPTIIYSLNDGVATIQLNRPEKHNAFDEHTITALEKAFQKASADPMAKVVVLCAEGKSFSAGADLNWMKRMVEYDYQDNLKDAQSLASMLKTLNFMPKPTIARVQGNAFGGAVGLVACCDIAIATENTQFSLSEVKLGLIPATISPYVIAAMGQRAARRYFLTGEIFSSQEATSLGLVSKITTADSLDTTVKTVIKQLLANSPNAIQEAKKLVFDVANQPIDDTLIQDTSKRIAEIRISQQGQEGLNAFLEKRTAQWEGSDSNV